VCVLLDIHPEPAPEERAGIADALERLRAEQEVGADRWWATGVRESVEGEDDEAV
jgi:hypothetical protein